MPTKDRFLTRGVVDVMALLGVAFMLTSLVAIIGVTNNPVKTRFQEAFAISEEAREKRAEARKEEARRDRGGAKEEKSWREIADPDARNAAKLVQEAQQAQQAQQVAAPQTIPLESILTPQEKQAIAYQIQRAGTSGQTLDYATLVNDSATYKLAADGNTQALRQIKEKDEGLYKQAIAEWQNKVNAALREEQVITRAASIETYKTAAIGGSDSALDVIKEIAPESVDDVLKQREALVLNEHREDINNAYTSASQGDEQSLVYLHEVAPTLFENLIDQTYITPKDYNRCVESGGQGCEDIINHFGEIDLSAEAEALKSEEEKYRSEAQAQIDTFLASGHNINEVPPELFYAQEFGLPLDSGLIVDMGLEPLRFYAGLKQSQTDFLEKCGNTQECYVKSRKLLLTADELNNTNIALAGYQEDLSIEDAVKKGQTYTAAASTITGVLLGGALAGQGTNLGQKFYSFGKVQTYLGYARAAKAQIENPLSEAANNTAIAAGLSGLNLFSAGAILQGKSYATILNTGVTGLNLAYDMNFMGQACTGPEANIENCGVANNMILADIAFGTLDLSQGQIGFSRYSPDIPTPSRFNIPTTPASPDLGTSRVSVPDPVVARTTVQNETILLNQLGNHQTTYNFGSSVDDLADLMTSKETDDALARLLPRNPSGLGGAPLVADAVDQLSTNRFRNILTANTDSVNLQNIDLTPQERDLIAQINNPRSLEAPKVNLPIAKAPIAEPPEPAIKAPDTQKVTTAVQLTAAERSEIINKVASELPNDGARAESILTRLKAGGIPENQITASDIEEVDKIVSQRNTITKPLAERVSERTDQFLDTVFPLRRTRSSVTGLIDSEGGKQPLYKKIVDLSGGLESQRTLEDSATKLRSTMDKLVNEKFPGLTNSQKDAIADETFRQLNLESAYPLLTKTQPLITTGGSKTFAYTSKNHPVGQDSAAIWDSNALKQYNITSVALVADGHGPGGEIASSVAKDNFLKHFLDSPNKDPKQAMDYAFKQLEIDIVNRLPDSGGTTLTAVVQIGDQVYVGHIGDSLLYVIDGETGAIRKITTDHNWQGGARKYGILLSRALGDVDVAYVSRGEFTSIPDILDPFNVKTGDRLVIGSDSLEKLSRVLGGQPQLERTLVNAVKGRQAEQAAETIANIAKDRSVNDDIGISVLSIDGMGGKLNGNLASIRSRTSGTSPISIWLQDSVTNLSNSVNHGIAQVSTSIGQRLDISKVSVSFSNNIKRISSRTSSDIKSWYSTKIIGDAGFVTKFRNNVSENKNLPTWLRKSLGTVPSPTNVSTTASTLEKSVTIQLGRNIQTDFFSGVENLSVSRLHGEITINPDGSLFYKDVGSQYGTSYRVGSSGNFTSVPKDGLLLTSQTELYFGKSTSIAKIIKDNGGNIQLIDVSGIKPSKTLATIFGKGDIAITGLPPTIPLTVTPNKPTFTDQVQENLTKLRNRLFPSTIPSPIKPGEVFDPEADVRNILKRPHSERKAALSEYKNKLAYQRKGTAIMETRIRNEILKNPDIDLAELMKEADDFGATYGLAGWQRDKISSALFLYDQRHSQVLDILKHYPDNNRLFEEMFGRKPKGKVEITPGATTLQVKIYHPEDFDFVYSGEYHNPDLKFKRGQYLTFGGFYMPFDTKLPGTNSLVLVENNTNLLYRLMGMDRAISIHENQHAINNLLKEAGVFPLSSGDGDQIFFNLVNAIDSGDRQAVELGLNQYLKYEKGNANADLQDEILAWLKTGSSNTETSITLTLPKFLGSPYDFYSGYREDFYYKSTNESINKLVADALAAEFSRAAYEKTVGDSLAAFDTLLVKGYTRDEAVAILEHTPLSNWSKLAARTSVPNLATGVTNYLVNKIVTPESIGIASSPFGILFIVDNVSTYFLGFSPIDRVKTAATDTLQNIFSKQSESSPNESSTTNIDIENEKATTQPTLTLSQKADMATEEIAKNPPDFGIDMATIGNLTVGHNKVSPELLKQLYQNYYTPSPAAFLASGTLYGDPQVAIATIGQYRAYMLDQMSKGFVLEASGKYGYHPELLTELENFKFLYKNSSYDHSDILLQNEGSAMYSFFRDINAVNGQFVPLFPEQLNPNQKRIYDFTPSSLVHIGDPSQQSPDVAMQNCKSSAGCKYIGIVATKSVNDLGRNLLLYKKDPTTGKNTFVGMVLVGDYAKRADWTGTGATTSEVFVDNPLGFRKANGQQWGFDLTEDLYKYFGGTGGPVTNIIAVDPNAVPEPVTGSVKVDVPTAPHSQKDELNIQEQRPTSWLQGAWSTVASWVGNLLNSKQDTSTKTTVDSTGVTSTLQVPNSIETPTASPSIESKPYVSKDEKGQIKFTEHYKILPEKSYLGRTYAPEMIILHWDGNPSASTSDWITSKTFQWLADGQVSSHFAVGNDGVLQMLPMTETTIQESKTVNGDYHAINIEFAGANFSKNSPSEKEIEYGVDLIVNLIREYDLSVDNIFGHYEINPGLSDHQDPGPEFLESIKKKVEAKLTSQP